MSDTPCEKPLNTAENETVQVSEQETNETDPATKREKEIQELQKEIGELKKKAVEHENLREKLEVLQAKSM